MLYTPTATNKQLQNVKGQEPHPSMTEQFSLRWNDFHANLSSAFHALLEGEDLVDVTLAAEGQYIQAHKLILSVCSPYFKELFKMNPCEHPIVILKDVQHAELRHILQFMYRGEVNVKQQDLTSFLHTAEMLQVKGLTVGRDRSPSPTPTPDDLVPYAAAPTNDESSKHGWGSHDEGTNDMFPREEDVKSPLKRLLTNTSKSNYQKKKPKIMPMDMSQEITEYISDNDQLTDCDSEMYHSVLDIPESAKESLIKQEGWNCKTGGVKCPSCHRFFANRYNLKVHIRDKHDTLEGTLQCEICHKTMRNPSCLRVHMYHHRKQAAFQAAQIIPSMFAASDLDGSSPVAGLIAAAQKCRPEAVASPPQITERTDNLNHGTAGGPAPVKREENNEPL